MEFLKRLGKSLFGSSRSSTPKKTSRPVKLKTPKKKMTKKIKKAVKKVVKKKTPKAKAKAVKKKTTPKKKQSAIVKSALAALPIAEVTHYFPHVNAAVLKIKVGDIRVGDGLHFKGHTTDFKEKVTSMQIDHKPVAIAKKGDDFGIEVKSRVRAGDLVYKIK